MCEAGHIPFPYRRGTRGWFVRGDTTRPGHDGGDGLVFVRAPARGSCRKGRMRGSGVGSVLFFSLPTPRTLHGGNALLSISNIGCFYRRRICSLRMTLYAWTQLPSINITGSAGNIHR